jgi:iron-sulfur cluster repair protein YtfE (RIC family)
MRSLDGPVVAFGEVRARLLTTLRDHERKEESILYPWIDRLLTEGESDSLVARIQAFPS